MYATGGTEAEAWNAGHWYVDGEELEYDLDIREWNGMERILDLLEMV